MNGAKLCWLIVGTLVPSVYFGALSTAVADAGKGWGLFGAGLAGYLEGTRPALGAGKQVLTIVDILALPTSERMLDSKLRQLGYAVDRVSIAPDTVERAATKLRKIPGPVILVGYSRGGRIAMALAAMPEFADKVKGAALFSPQIKTLHSAWKKAYGTELPDHATFRAQGGERLDDLFGFGRYDEHAQEEGIQKPTLLFYGDRDQLISHHYQERVAHFPTNTGIRAFCLEGEGHEVGYEGRGAGYGSHDELMTTQIAALVEHVAENKPPELFLPGKERLNKVTGHEPPRRGWDLGQEEKHPVRAEVPRANAGTKLQPAPAPIRPAPATMRPAPATMRPETANEPEQRGQLGRFLGRIGGALKGHGRR